MLNKDFPRVHTGFDFEFQERADPVSENSRDMFYFLYETYQNIKKHDDNLCISQNTYLWGNFLI